jgi:Ni/Co efflux regulator RcnB
MNIIAKGLLSTVAAGFLAAGPIAVSTASADQVGLGVQLGQQQDRDRDHDNRCDDNRCQRDGRDNSCDDRKEWRDDRNNTHWDNAQHNGYYSNNGWHFGPPPPGVDRGRSFYLGYHPWARGDRLGYYNSRYVEVNYRSQNLKRPKRGQHWVRDDRGVYILASMSTGIISQVVNRNARW